MITKLFLIIISAVIVNNFVLTRFLGICPFLGVSRKTDTAVGMGLAVIFVITMSSAMTFLIYEYILAPFNLAYLKTIVFILVIAAFVQTVEIILKKTNIVLYQALGIFLPLITTNCIVLAVAILNIDQHYNLLESVVFGFGAASGFALALVIMSGIRERLEFAEVPKELQGIPIALILAGLLSIAFFGFQNLVKF
ncbi:MAG: electron transport complex subunit RsxA [Candidatus Omnitrophica bacterium]|nr:electron transport complex subunit RsxA [Candidatus Omnitrophota bacterium]